MGIGLKLLADSLSEHIFNKIFACVNISLYQGKQLLLLLQLLLEHSLLLVIVLQLRHRFLLNLVKALQRVFD